MVAPCLAQGATIIPTYGDVHMKWEGALTARVTLDTPSPFDPDLLIHKHNFVQSVGQNIRQKASLDKWVAIAHITHMDLEDFLNLDEFWQEAVFQSVNNFVKEQNKEQQSALNSMTEKIEALRPYSSPMSALPKPQFNLP